MPIVELARDLIRLSGLEAGRDIDIAFIGIRPGEKLCEELFANGEEYERTYHEKILVCVIANPKSKIGVDALIAVVQQGDLAAVRRLLKEIVPEYQPPA